MDSEQVDELNSTGSFISRHLLFCCSFAALLLLIYCLVNAHLLLISKNRNEQQTIKFSRKHVLLTELIGKHVLLACRARFFIVWDTLEGTWIWHFPIEFMHLRVSGRKAGRMLVLEFNVASSFRPQNRYMRSQERAESKYGRISEWA